MDLEIDQGDRGHCRDYLFCLSNCLPLYGNIIRSERRFRREYVGYDVRLYLLRR